MADRLIGRVCLVTGSSAGIGRAIAVAFAREGARLVIVGRNLDELRKTHVQMGQPDAIVEKVDLTKAGAAERLAANVQERFGQLDVLVHCAGSIRYGMLDAASTDDFDHLLKSNLIAPFELTRSLSQLLSSARGDIVFLNSSIVRFPRPEVGQYASTQHAVMGLSETLRQEMNAKGVRVTSIHAGRTATPRMERLFHREGRSYQPERLLQPEDIAETVVTVVSLPRTAEVTELHIRPHIKH